MEETNYNIKIQNFLLMTDTGNQDIDLQYLEAANWDETLAVNNFFKKSTPIDNSTNNELIEDSIIPKNTENNSITSDNNRLNRNLINQKNNNINIDIEPNKKIVKKRKLNFFQKCIFIPINFLLDCCTERREVTKSEEKKIFHYLPNINDDFFNFCQLLKKKIGIIIFYTSNNILFLNDLISQICRSTMSFNMLKNNFIIYPILANTNEGKRLQNIVSDNQLIFPSFAFCYNSSKYPSALLMRNHIIFILDGGKITVKSFHDTLLETSKKINKSKDNNSINEFDKSFGHLTDAEILNQQNFDMEKLEKEVIKKEEELKKERLIEEKRKKDEEMKMKEIEEKAKQAKEKLVEEPSPDDPDSTIICFRYPDGDKTINRRFLKSHTIQNLYDYITSFGNEIYTEKENNSFSLFQPFPPKKYDVMENTLEKEGLFPNAVVQIREE